MSPGTPEAAACWQGLIFDSEAPCPHPITAEGAQMAGSFPPGKLAVEPAIQLGHSDILGAPHRPSAIHFPQ